MDKDKTNEPAKPEPESLETSDGAKPPAASQQTTSSDNAGQAEVTSPQNLGSQAPSAKPDTPKIAFYQRILNFPRLYLAAFVLLIIIAAMVVYISTSSTKKNASPQTKETSLTSSQIAQLEGNTTLVGDAKQTLDIQGNTIFEGQGLFRNDLSAAGALKVGSSISGQTLNVGGLGNFNQLQVSQTFSVAGDSSLAGQLSVKKNLNVTGSGSFGGNLTAAQLSVTTLQISGDFSLSRHLVTSGATPNKSDGTALGGGGTASVSGTDTAGTININTGNSPPAGNFVTINFNTKFANTPHVVVTPIGSAGANLQYYVTRTSASFTLATANAPPAGASFSFDYVVVD